MKPIFNIIFGAIAGPVFLVIGIGIIYYTFTIVQIDPKPVISIVIALTPIWLPFVLFSITFNNWIEFVQLRSRLDNGRTTLRLKLPQEVFKSPETMESVLAQIHNMSSASNLWEAYIDGKHPLTYSFELVSFGGDVRFYINVPTKKTKNAVEAQLYAQYPGIEVVEEKIDYASEIVWDPNKYEMMSFHFNKKEDQMFPIKTYIDFGMDKLPKEEQKFEPMAAMLEQISSIKPYERVWVQILATPHGKRNFMSGVWDERPAWDKSARAKIDELLGRNPKTKLGPGEIEEQPRLTMGERDNVAAIERNISKYAYDTAIRWMYITQKGKFDGNFIGPMIRTFSQYDIIGRNAIGFRWRTDFDYNWFSDYSGKKKLQLKEAELKDYKLRSYTTRDPLGGSDAPKVYSVEELATMFHIPGSSVVTPGLSRIPSTRKEAPPNLPTGIPMGI